MQALNERNLLEKRKESELALAIEKATQKANQKWKTRLEDQIRMHNEADKAYSKQTENLTARVQTLISEQDVLLKSLAASHIQRIVREKIRTREISRLRRHLEMNDSSFSQRLIEQNNENEREVAAIIASRDKERAASCLQRHFRLWIIAGQRKMDAHAIKRACLKMREVSVKTQKPQPSRSSIQKSHARLKAALGAALSRVARAKEDIRAERNKRVQYEAHNKKLMTDIERLSRELQNQENFHDLLSADYCAQIVRLSDELKESIEVDLDVKTVVSTSKASFFNADEHSEYTPVQQASRARVLNACIEKIA